MKMLPKISMFLAMLGLITFVACEKESNNVTPVQNVVNESQFFKGVSEKNGMLVFENDANVQMLTELMLADKARTTKQLNNQFPKFRSNRIAYEQLIAKIDVETLSKEIIKANNHLICTVDDEVGESYLQKTIDSHFLSSICNEDGFFQVGATIYKITKDLIYQYDAQSRVEKRKDKITRKVIVSDDRGGENNDLFYNCSGSKKLRARFFANSSIVFSEAGCSAENTKKNLLGVTVGSNVSFINVSGSYTVNRFQFTSPGTMCSSTSFTANKTKFNDSYVEDIGTSCWGCCGQLAVPNFISTATATNCGPRTVTVSFP